MEKEKCDDGLKFLIIEGDKYKTKLSKKYETRKPWAPANEKVVSSFIPGTIFKVYVAEGETVTKGQDILILDAMKMKNHIVAPIEGKVKKIYVEAGQTVTNKQVLFEME